MSEHEGTKFAECNKFIISKQNRITLSQRIFNELTLLNKRRTTKINNLIISSLAKMKNQAINLLSVMDVLDEVDASHQLSNNDHRYIEDLLFYCKERLDPSRPISELIIEFRRVLATSAKQFIYISANLQPVSFSLNVAVVDLICPIINNQNDAEHLSDAFQWNLENSDNQFFVTHDKGDILDKIADIIKKIRGHEPKSTLEISRVRKVIHL